MSSEACKTPLLSHKNFTPAQNDAIEALYGGNRLLIAQKGFGKAAVGLTAVAELIEDGELDRVLIIAPLKVCQLTLANEWRKWEHLERPAMAIGDANVRSAAIDSGAPIVVMNIENIPWLFEVYGDQHGFDGLLIDEMSKFKAAGSTGVKTLRKHSRDFLWRCGMSASPVAESGTDIYAQILLLDSGAALGTNQDRFRRTYFYPTDFNERNWAILPGKDVALADAIKDVVYVATDAAYAADLPELRDQVVNVTLDKRSQLAYDEMCKGAYIEAHDIEAVNAAVVSGKLQQITAGAVYDETRRAHWLHTLKVDALQRILRDADGPVAVAYWFQFEKEMLAATFPEMLFLGDDPGKVEQMWNTGTVRLMGIHPRSASHGLNLQYGGHELVVLTVPWGADPWEQTLGRFHRRGQRSKFVRRTCVVVPGSVDEIVLDRHLDKSYDENSLMDHITAAAK